MYELKTAWVVGEARMELGDNESVLFSRQGYLKCN